MLKHILVPLDGSALSEQALNYAENVIAPNGNITLLSVVEVPVDYEYALLDIPMTAMSLRQYSEDEYNIIYRHLQDYLKKFASRLTAKGFTVECVVETGDPAMVINEVANTNHTDAIVMTTHGRTGLNRWLFGSVTQKVMAHMLRPVLVVPGTVSEKTEVPIVDTTQAPATS